MEYLDIELKIEPHDNSEMLAKTETGRKFYLPKKAVLNPSDDIIAITEINTDCLNDTHRQNMAPAILNEIIGT